MKCRHSSGWGSGSTGLLMGPDAGEELRFFEVALRNTLCLVNCKKEHLGQDRWACSHQYVHTK